MGLFSKLFKQHVGDESEQTMELLSKWERNHFRSCSSSHTNGAECYSTFCRDTGETVSLAGIYLQEKGKKSSKGLLGVIKEFVDPAPKKSIPSVIAEYRNNIYNEIQRFKNNVLKYEKLSAEIKADGFFLEIDHIFNVKLKILYNEMLFCKFENLGELSYFEKTRNKVRSVYKDLQAINTAFYDYMYASTRIEYENTSHDLEIIKTKVKAMHETAETTAYTNLVS